MPIFRDLINVQGGLYFKRTNINLDYTVIDTDVHIIVTDTAAARNITIPLAQSKRARILWVSDQSGGAATNNITLTPASPQTINASATYVISANYGSVGIYCNSDTAGNWFTLAKF